MLYASQWFLTIYSCPFPATFACRVIDVMLTEHSSNVLMRAALAVLAECEDDLLQLHDFEDLITYLKVGALQTLQSRIVYFDSERSFLHWKSKLRNAWGQKIGFLHCEDLLNLTTRCF